VPQTPEEHYAGRWSSATAAPFRSCWTVSLVAKLVLSPQAMLSEGLAVGTVPKCDLEKRRSIAGKGKHGTFLADISKFYLEYHQSVYNRDLVFLHDPCALVAAVKPELFTWKAGAVVVGLQGPLRGKTLLDGDDPSSTGQILGCVRWICVQTCLEVPFAPGKFECLFCHGINFKG
jgi:hypothetical protein